MPPKRELPPTVATGDTLSNSSTLAAGSGARDVGTAPTLASDDALALTGDGAPPPVAAAPRAADAGSDAASVPGPVDATIAPLDDAGGFAARYEVRKVLGAGGMGEVRLCRDKRIGREVALKVIRPRVADSAEVHARFVREARVQGQLEHPSVVPVYDLGTDPDGAVFFTMKRVRGMTLEQILAGLAEDAPGMSQRYSRRKLLTAFGNVCLAIDFAHARGVLHRDLKPANVMLGDFGEVHVLDWGLARVAGAIDATSDEASAERADALEPRGSAPQTRFGAILGTPGYMAPEQARGQLDKLDARTDVYALGAILFELLTLAPLHDVPSAQLRLISTVEGADARPSVRAPGRDVPPELEAVCVRATALDPAARYASARELSDAIERYLDGDRDVQRRRELAEAHAAAADAALAAVSASDPAAARAARAAAMQDVTRALALDPGHPAALRTLAQLLTDVPRELPPEAEAELAASAADARENAARVSAIRYATWVAFVPLVAWMGVRHWPVGVVTLLALLLSTAAAFALWRRGRPSVVPAGFALLVLSSVAIGGISGLFGPFVLVPALAATNTMFFAMNAERRHRVVIVAVGVLAMLVPFGLDVLGATPPAYGFHRDLIAVHPRMAYFPTFQTLLALLVGNAAMVITPAVLVGRLRDALTAAERRVLMHAWHLRQLVPDAARQSLVGSEPRG